jgi:hypothetical protein
VLILILLSKRKRLPIAIKMRQPLLSMALTCNLAFFMSVKNYITQSYPESSFLLWDVIASLNIAGFCPFVYFLRTWKIVFEAEQSYAAANKQGQQDSWFLKHSRFGENQVVVFAAIIGFGVHCIIGIIVAGSINAVSQEASNGYTIASSAAGEAALVVILCYMVANAVLAYRVQSPYPKSDVWWIKFEIFMTMFMAGVFLFVWLSLVESKQHTEALHCLNVASALMVFWHVGYTIIGCCRKEHGVDMMTPSPRASVSVNQDKNNLLKKYKDGVSLSDGLKDAEMLARYRKFLETEFSVDILNFFLEVESLKEACSNSPDSKVSEMIGSIFSKYIANGASHDITLYLFPDTLTELQSKCQRRKKSAADAFDSAQNEIAQLMDHDTFKRFLKTLKIKHLPLAVI